MKLDLDHLAQYIQGAEAIVRKDDCIVPHRFTAAEMHAFDGNADFRRKSYAASCVRLAFSTDATGFTMAYHVVKGSSRTFYYFDVYVNGVMVQHSGHESFVECPDNELHVTLDGKPNTVVIYFPCLSEIDIKSFDLEGGHVIAPAIRLRTLFCYGDSITQGYDARYPSLAYANQLGDALCAEVFNKAIGGDVFNPALVTATGPHKPDIITVAYGTNDWSHKNTKETFFAQMNGFYANLHNLYPNVPVFAILPIWRRDHDRVTDIGTFDELRGYLTEAVKPYANFRLLDGYQYVPHLEEAFSDKYLHPNDFGFEFYAKNLIAEIKDALKR
ncbi:MAG: SGNH/GDSL hydrolase family protein [Victivallales bacterium]|nr:SGNH/GDSL hydrolase family protein [Victivallales bacterium]